MDSHKKYPPLGVEVISEFEEFEEFISVSSPELQESSS